MAEKLNKEDIALKGTRGAIFNMAAAGLSKICGLIFYIMLLRVVTAGEGGIYFLFLAIASIIGIFGAFGISDSLIRFIPFYQGSKQSRKIKPLLFTAAILFFFFSAFVVFSAWLGQNLIVEYYNKELAPVLFITALSGVAFSSNAVLHGALIGLKKFEQNASFTALNPILKILFLAIFFSYFSPSVEYAIYATLIAACITSCGMFFFVIKKLKEFPGRFELLKTNEIFKIIKYGFTTLINHFSIYIMGWSDTLILGYYVLSPIVGAYGAIIAIARTSIHLIASQIFHILISILSHLHGAKSNIFGPLAQNAARVGVYATIPCMSLIMLFAKEIVELCFPVYSEFYWLLYLFIPGFFIGAFSFPASSALSAVGRADLVFKSTALGIVPNIVLNIMLIPSYGALGAACATIVSFIISEITVLKYAEKYAKFGYHPLLINAIVPGILMMLVAVTANTYLFNFLAGDWFFEILRVLFVSSLAVLFYFIFLVKLGAFSKMDELIAEKIINTVRCALFKNKF